MKRMLCMGMFIILCLTYACRFDKPKKEMQAKIGVNQEIAGPCDAALAAVCHNGTFVGKMEGEVLSFKEIPYAEPPVGSLRWKKPVLAGKRDGVYEARHFGKSPVPTPVPMISDTRSNDFRHLFQGEQEGMVNAYRG